MSHREVMQKALEALEDLGMKHYESTGEVLHRDVYEALRTALAEFDADPQNAGQTQTESKQEPVAWRVLRSDGQYELYFVKASAKRAAECYISRPQVEPLYTHPAPQRQPLTDEDIETAYREIWRDLPSDFEHTSAGWIEQGIRYAERKHGIGGQDE